MDADCCARGIAKKYFHEPDPDLYDFESKFSVFKMCYSYQNDGKYIPK